MHLTDRRYKRAGFLSSYLRTDEVRSPDYGQVLGRHPIGRAVGRHCAEELEQEPAQAKTFKTRTTGDKNESWLRDVAAEHRVSSTMQWPHLFQRSFNLNFFWLFVPWKAPQKKKKEKSERVQGVLDRHQCTNKNPHESCGDPQA